MHAGTDRLEFAPPPQPAAVRAFVLAILAHLLLLLALTWGINWKRDADEIAVEAELWSSVPQQAAPAVVQAPPLPAPAPAPAPAPVPAPPPPAPKVVAPPAPAPRPPDIALEREKKKQELAERRREELELKKKIEAREKREELEREKKLEARRKQEELKRQEIAEKKAAEEKKKKAEELAKAKARQEEARKQAEAKAKQEEAKLAALRKENMDRMMKGATGGPSANGSAERASGPSQSYAGRIRARVRPNIVFTDDVSGNPTAEVEVRMAPDGTITSRKIIKSSGERSWDQAVLRALDKTEVLPRDVDGTVHTPLIIQFKPKG